MIMHAVIISFSMMLYSYFNIKASMCNSI